MADRQVDDQQRLNIASQYCSEMRCVPNEEGNEDIKLTLGPRAAGTGALRLLENFEFIMKTTAVTSSPCEADGISHTRRRGRRT